MNAYTPPQINYLYVLLSISSLRPNYYLPFSPSTTAMPVTLMDTPSMGSTPSQAVHNNWRRFPLLTQKVVGKKEIHLVTLVSSFEEEK
jgi:hypothetical protein